MIDPAIPVLPSFSDEVTQVNLTITIALPPLLEAWLNSQTVELNAALARIDAKQEAAQKGIEAILMDEKQIADVLTKIDAATTDIGVNLTAVGVNVQTMGTVAATISTDVDALVAGLQHAGVSQALIDQATAVGTKTDALETAATLTKQATDSLVPVLNGIATKAGNPVPVPVPAPPQPVLVP